MSYVLYDTSSSAISKPSRRVKAKATGPWMTAETYDDVYIGQRSAHQISDDQAGVRQARYGKSTHLDLIYATSS